MKYVFFGSPDFAATFLKHTIKAGLVPVAVVCNPDRPVGRKKTITPPPVKELVATYNQQLTTKDAIQILQPANKKELIAMSNILKSFQADLFVVAAYANILPDPVLSLATRGVVGVHPSLLPQYRGATPIQSVLLAGETKTGTSLYQMDASVDHGPIITQSELSITPNETYLSLEQKLAELSAHLFISKAAAYSAGSLKPVEQNHAAATFTKKFETKDAEVDFKNDDPLVIYKTIQALNPEPGVYTFSFPKYEGKRVKLLAARYQDGSLQVTEIQPDGKKPLLLTA